MKFIVYGAGALGSLFAALLSTKHDVLLIGRKEHIEAIRKNGLKIEGVTKGVFYPEVEWDGSKYDVVLLTTKSYDTRKAVREIKEKFGKIDVLSLQNGLRNEEIIAEEMGMEYALGGITSHGATFLQAGKIYHAGKGETVIGELNGEITERIRKIANAFNECGIETKISRNIKRDIWRKAIVNSAINGLSAVLRCKNGEILRNEYAEKLLEEICKEGIRVANAEGMEIGNEVIKMAKEILHRTADNISSMLQDILKGKRTEVEEINGEIVKTAEKHGMEAKFNKFLTYVIKAMENVRHLG
ncbi:MAG: 2-dehydropantoate 2-reductase [Thermoplasmata archaeon]|nr:2-dehydropantoate 2-reductase [Thermoplasmata archaeon]